MIDDDAPKIYGLDTINSDATVYITEGPFDSTFLPNAIAMCGADLVQRDWGISDCCWVFDNEPRNFQICRSMVKSLQDGWKVVVWPKSITCKCNENGKIWYHSCFMFNLPCSGFQSFS